ncbi:hypothetical protein BX616_009252 [Lobosporangium transversale]|nr:hypothetical protein BX616_009252 [Lobosporangium transversale]
MPDIRRSRTFIEQDQQSAHQLFVDAQGQPLQICISRSVQNSSDLENLIRQNGGTITQNERTAFICLADPGRKYAQAMHSTDWIRDCIQKQTLVNHNSPEYQLQLANRTAKSYYSLEDDNLLRQYIKEKAKENAKLKGNCIYQDFAEAHKQHSWQSWRDRAVRVLKLTDPPSPYEFSKTKQKGPLKMIEQKEVQTKRPDNLLELLSPSLRPQLSISSGQSNQQMSMDEKGFNNVSSKIAQKMESALSQNPVIIDHESNGKDTLQYQTQHFSSQNTAPLFNILELSDIESDEEEDNFHRQNMSAIARSRENRDTSQKAPLLSEFKISSTYNIDSLTCINPPSKEPTQHRKEVTPEKLTPSITNKYSSLSPVKLKQNDTIEPQDSRISLRTSLSPMDRIDFKPVTGETDQATPAVAMKMSKLKQTSSLSQSSQSSQSSPSEALSSTMKETTSPLLKSSEPPMIEMVLTTEGQALRSPFPPSMTPIRWVNDPQEELAITANTLSISPITQDLIKPNGHQYTTDFVGSELLTPMATESLNLDLLDKDDVVVARRIVQAIKRTDKIIRPFFPPRQSSYSCKDKANIDLKSTQDDGSPFSGFDLPAKLITASLKPHPHPPRRFQYTRGWDTQTSQEEPAPLAQAREAHQSLAQAVEDKGISTITKSDTVTFIGDQLDDLVLSDDDKQIEAMIPRVKGKECTANGSFINIMIPSALTEKEETIMQDKKISVLEHDFGSNQTVGVKTSGAVSQGTNESDLPATDNLSFDDGVELGDKNHFNDVISSINDQEASTELIQLRPVAENKTQSSSKQMQGDEKDDVEEALIRRRKFVQKLEHIQGIISSVSENQTTTTVLSKNSFVKESQVEHGHHVETRRLNEPTKVEQRVKKPGQVTPSKLQQPKNDSVGEQVQVGVAEGPQKPIEENIVTQQLHTMSTEKEPHSGASSSEITKCLSEGIKEHTLKRDAIQAYYSLDDARNRDDPEADEDILYQRSQLLIYLRHLYKDEIRTMVMFELVPQLKAIDILDACSGDLDLARTFVNDGMTGK